MPVESGLKRELSKIWEHKNEHDESFDLSSESSLDAVLLTRPLTKEKQATVQPFCLNFDSFLEDNYKRNYDYFETKAK